MFYKSSTSCFDAAKTTTTPEFLFKTMSYFIRPIQFGKNCHFLPQIMEAAGGRSCWYHSGPPGSHPGVVIYCKHSLIWWEICHNTESVRRIPPVAGAFSSPTGSPCQTPRNKLFVILAPRPSYITERAGMEKTSAEKHKAWTSYEPNNVSVCVCGPRGDTKKTNTVNHGNIHRVSYRH